MRVLLVKTSSMGDVVHTLPALTDAAQALPGIQFDWVVEEAFQAIPAMHPAVADVLPVALRRWRKHPLRTWRSGEWRQFRERLQAQTYDRVIDAQGLIKSAFLTRRARGEKHGLDKASAREGWSARALDVAHAVPREQHAISRVRQLFADALGYALPDTAPDYGVQAHGSAAGNRLVFFHGTTWPTKHWPMDYWRRLAGQATEAGYEVLLPHGDDMEKQRAEAIAAGNPGARVMPRMPLGALIETLQGLDGFVAVDTGLAHLAAAAGLPGVALYGPTDPSLTGVLGARARSLSAAFPCAPCVQEQCTYRGDQGAPVQPPCFSTLPPETVWGAFREVMGP
ncbi:MAG: lipopolysaccharide heptosyltransferase I [Alcanivoracaceae bacterium]|nr:lipopolysaccharide heptosyltransferase I [Alcanivoracaceae bacterium]